MPEINKGHLYPTDVDVTISEIHDGIYRIAGFVEAYGITFNQFLIDDEQPSFIHTGPVGMYTNSSRTEGKRGYSYRKIGICCILAF